MRTMYCNLCEEKIDTHLSHCPKCRTRLFPFEFEITKDTESASFPQRRITIYALIETMAEDGYKAEWKRIK